MTGLDVTTEWDDRICVLALKGEARLETVPRFDETVGTVLERGVEHLLVDLSRLQFMDSASTGSLIRLRGLVAKQGGSLVLFGMRGVVLRLFERAGLDEGFVCAADEVSARALIPPS